MSKTISTAMATYLKSDFIQLATCLNIQLKNTDVVAITDWQAPVTYAGTTYKTLFETFAMSAMDNSVGLGVPTVNATGLTGQALIGAGGINNADIEGGIFDGATFTMFQMVPSDTNATTYGIIKLRAGRFGKATSVEGQYTIELRGLTSLLQQTYIQTYNLACNADLFDTRCGLSPDAFTDGCTVTGSISGGNLFTFLTGTNRATGFYNAGVLTWTGGLNTGLSIEVKTHEAGNGFGDFGSLLLYLPMEYAIQIGDTFYAQAGCDKSLTTCANVFNNAINHRGFPYIPGLDTYFYANAALAYPTSDS